MHFRRNTNGGSLALLLVWLSACGGGATDESPPFSDPSKADGVGGGDGSVWPDGGSAIAEGSDASTDLLEDGSTSADSEDGSASCPPPPACDAAPPEVGPATSWRNLLPALLATSSGAAQHRGRDLVLTTGDEQWIIGKIAYGTTDKDLEDEDVDIYVLRDCDGPWERLGTVQTTTDDGPRHPTVERIADDGGRVFFRIPAEARLGVGRHRIHLVVKGDLSRADSFIDVVDGPTPYIVSDVDGTLTEDEWAEWTAPPGSTVGAQPHAADALEAAVARGYRVFYLTARPDWRTTRTHQWLADNGFPLGIVHTTDNSIGAIGDAAVEFKTEEIEELSARTGGPPAYAIGNSDTDAQAYRDTGIAPTNRYLYHVDSDAAAGGVVFDDYRTLVTLFDGASDVCR